MASSTPAHCTISGAKPYQGRRRSSISPHIPVAKTPTGSANVCHRNPSFPSLAARTDIGLDFCGRRSTRLVSKMHFGRPKAGSLLQRHTSAAEELLQYVTQPGLDDEIRLGSALVGSESKMRGSEDYVFLLRELGNRGDVNKAMRCYQFAVSSERRRTEQGKLASAMISVLGRLGKAEMARGVFDEACREGYGNTVYVFSALISAYGRSGYCKEAIGVFESMKGRRLKPNLVTYNAVIDACGKGGGEFGKAVEVFEEMVRRGVQPDRITYNSLLAVCGRGGDWVKGRNLFREMVVCRGIEPDIFTYNTLLDCVCKGGQMDLAFDIMSEMVDKSLSPNVVSYSTVIDGFAKEGRFSEALALFNRMKMAGVGLDRVLFNTLLSIYAKLGRFDDVLAVCVEMEGCGIIKDAVTYNALIGGYGRQGMYDDVKRVFSEMKFERVSPNLLTYSTLIDVYSKAAFYEEAMEVFREFKQTGLKPDVVLYSALIDSFCKSGMVELAVCLLDKMTLEGIRPNVVTYNSIIDAFGRSSTSCGDTSWENTSCEDTSRGDIIRSLGPSSLAEYDNVITLESNNVMRAFGQLVSQNLHFDNRDISVQCELYCILDVFRKMNDHEIKPNVVTFSAILNACSRCNSIEDASMLLEELRLFDDQVYGVAHGLLMGLKDNIWVHAVALFDEVKHMDSTTATAFFNALTDMLWHFGQKYGAEVVAMEGKRRKVWENVWTDSCLDLHLMSSGAARAMVHAWLLSIRTVVFQGQELPKLLSILTGWGKHSKVVGEGALRRAIAALLSGLGAPFRVANTNLGRFISTGSVVASWLRDSRTLTLLLLRDVKTACSHSLHREEAETTISIHPANPPPPL